MSSANCVVERAEDERQLVLPTGANGYHPGSGLGTLGVFNCGKRGETLGAKSKPDPPAQAVSDMPRRRLARRSALSRIISVKSAAGRISKGPNLTPGCFDINSMA